MNPRAAVVLASALALLSGCSESGPGQARDEILALPDIPARAAFEALCEFVVERTG